MTDAKDILLAIARDYDTRRARAAYENGKRLDAEDPESEVRSDERVVVTGDFVTDRNPIAMWLDLVRR